MINDYNRMSFENTFFAARSIDAFRQLKNGKTSFVRIDVPSEVSKEQASNWISLASYALDCHGENDSEAAIEMFETECPANHRRWVLKAAISFNGIKKPAVCIRWTKEESKKWSKNTKHQGERGFVYTFSGYIASDRGVK